MPWSLQPNLAATIDPAALQRSVESIARRRSRLLTYQVAGFALVLLVYPALSVANFRFLHPTLPLLFWASVVLHVAVFIAFFVYGVRRLIRHWQNRRRTAASVRECALHAVATVESDMRDTRAGSWIIPLSVGLAFLSGYTNAASHYTAARFAQQLVVLAIIIVPIASAVWRDYQVNLKPTRDDLRSVLADAD
jgi:hypothetical protein